MVTVYASNLSRDTPFLTAGPFPNDSNQLVLVGDWNAILDPKIDRFERRASGSDRRESNLIDFMAQRNLVDRFCLDLPGIEMRAWIDNSLLSPCKI